MSMALLWKVQWIHLKNAAPHQWRLNTKQCALLAACGILLSSIVGALALRIFGASTESPLAPSALLVALVAVSLTTISAYFVLQYFSRAEIKNQGATQTTELNTSFQVATTSICVAKNMAIGVVGFFIVWPLVQVTSLFGGAIQFYFTDVQAPTVGHQFLETILEQGNNPITWGLIFTIVILGPLAEEIVWRGAIQQGLKQIGVPRAGAILITAAVFALFHWDAVPKYGHAAAIPALAVFGIALGFLMERTGRLWGSFMAHALFNCANIFLFSMLPQ